jgi:hypothetical protein
MAMAISDSVTVSMGLETRGDFNVIFFVNGLISSTSLEPESSNFYIETCAATRAFYGLDLFESRVAG